MENNYHCQWKYKDRKSDRPARCMKKQRQHSTNLTLKKKKKKADHNFQAYMDHIFLVLFR